MRSLKLGFLILLHCGALSAAELIVRPPSTLLVPTMQHLRDHCGAAGHYDGCARFVAFRLEASCAPADANTWSISARATYAPWIFLYNMHQLSHELEHLGDVRVTIEQHLASLEALRFESDSDCAQRSLGEAKSFEETIRAAAVKSNLTRHPQLRFTNP